MPYLRETIKAGNAIEVREYYTARYGKKGERRQSRKGETALAVQAVNHRNSERKLRGLLRANFGEEDWLVTLTYRRGCKVDEQQAHKDVQKMLRKLKKFYIVEEKALKYIYVIEKLTQTVHIHMVLPKIKAESVRKCWLDATEKAIGAHFEPLWGGDFATKLASYLLKEYDPKKENYRKPTGTKYHASRNLTKPEIEKRVMKRWEMPKKPFTKKGYIMLPDSFYQGVDAYTGCEYRTYTLLRA